jgi:2-dehydropantoate 2-reductase
MKIAVVGCGALGGYYAACLCRAGHEVHVLLRSDYAVVRREGIRIRSVNGDFAVHPRCARSSEEIGVSEVVLIALKTTANATLPLVLPPLVGPETMVVSLENGLGDEEQVAAVVGEERVLGGLCFVCLNRTAPGVVEHTAHGRIVLGEHRRSPMPRTELLAAVFRAAGVPCQVTEDLARSHWEKLTWNIPFNGLGVAAVVGYDNLAAGRCPTRREPGPTWPTDRLLADARWAGWVRGLMDEVILAAQAQGHDLRGAWADELIERTRSMGAYRASTLLDFEQGKPLELESLFLEPLRRARVAGVRTPKLERLCAVLGELAGAAELKGTRDSKNPAK